jgi:hypothetical protein
LQTNLKIKIMAKQKISLSDFSFQFLGNGNHNVTYRSASGEKFQKLITDTAIIDCTKGAAKPKIVDLERLRAMCKA